MVVYEFGVGISTWCAMSLQVCKVLLKLQFWNDKNGAIMLKGE